jgi:branched-chain amino acid transport system ATP-binding protein
LSFVVQEHEILGLIGPNGAGKSTVVSLIAGAHKPDSGEIRFEGRNIAGVAAHDVARRGIARTFQLTSPFPMMSVRNNTVIGALFAAKGGSLRQTEAFQLADEVLDQVGLWPKRNSLGSQLTVGDRKRLELARALAMRPKVILLDEVMAGLNVHELDEIIPVIRQVNARGVTIVVIEHVMKAIVALCQRVVVLHHGQFLAQGTPHDIANNRDVIREYLGARYAQA